jgi:hypothetical protein
VTARGSWDTSACTVAESEAVFDRLHLVGGPGEVVVYHTVGQGLPKAIAEEWLAWAGPGLDAAQRLLVAEPTSTLRIETTVGGEAHQAARWGFAVAAEMALLLDAVLIDVAAVRLWAPRDLDRFTGSELDVRSWVSVHAEPNEDSTYDLHTHGLARLGGLDLEMGGVVEPLLPFGVRALNELASHQVAGHTIRSGEPVLVEQEYAFSLSSSARFAEHCQNGVLALVDPPEAPHRDVRSPRNTLARFAHDVALELVGAHRLLEARPMLDQAIALAPWRPTAYEARADILAALGDTDAAQADRAQALVAWSQAGGGAHASATS